LVRGRVVTAEKGPINESKSGIGRPHRGRRPRRRRTNSGPGPPSSSSKTPFGGTSTEPTTTSPRTDSTS
jgi:hypothetical protein